MTGPGAAPVIAVASEVATGSESTTAVDGSTAVGAVEAGASVVSVVAGAAVAGVCVFRRDRSSTVLVSYLIQI